MPVDVIFPPWLVGSKAGKVWLGAYAHLLHPLPSSTTQHQLSQPGLCKVTAGQLLALMTQHRTAEREKQQPDQAYLKCYSCLHDQVL